MKKVLIGIILTLAVFSQTKSLPKSRLLSELEQEKLKRMSYELEFYRSKMDTVQKEHNDYAVALCSSVGVSDLKNCSIAPDLSNVTNTTKDANN